MCVHADIPLYLHLKLNKLLQFSEHGDRIVLFASSATPYMYNLKVELNYCFNFQLSNFIYFKFQLSQMWQIKGEGIYMYTVRESKDEG